VFFENSKTGSGGIRVRGPPRCKKKKETTLWTDVTLDALKAVKMNGYQKGGDRQDREENLSPPIEGPKCGEREQEGLCPRGGIEGTSLKFRGLERVQPCTPTGGSFRDKQITTRGSERIGHLLSCGGVRGSSIIATLLKGRILNQTDFSRGKGKGGEDHVIGGGLYCIMNYLLDTGRQRIVNEGGKDSISYVTLGGKDLSRTDRKDMNYEKRVYPRGVRSRWATCGRRKGEGLLPRGKRRRAQATSGDYNPRGEVPLSCRRSGGGV